MKPAGAGSYLDWSIPPGRRILNALESNFITAHVVGHWLTFDPVAIVLSFLFFGLAVGRTGYAAGVPILAATKIICDHIGQLVPAGEFLG
jgi:putative heme transporter